MAEGSTYFARVADRRVAAAAGMAADMRRARTDEAATWAAEDGSACAEPRSDQACAEAGGKSPDGDASDAEDEREEPRARVDRTEAGPTREVVRAPALPESALPPRPAFPARKPELPRSKPSAWAIERLSAMGPSMTQLAFPTSKLLVAAYTSLRRLEDLAQSSSWLIPTPRRALSPLLPPLVSAPRRQVG